VANSSIKAAILTALGFKVDENVPHHHPALNITTPEVIAKRYMKYLKLAIVRNPWDRLVSCYLQKICGDPVLLPGLINLGFYYQMPFDEFIKRICKNPAANVHFAPQLGALSYKGQVLPDIIGRFENIDDVWIDFQSMCPLTLGKLPHYNKLNRPHYRKFFNDKNRQCVADIYSPEIEYFQYEF
jgi:hypothetical protein